MKGFLWVVVSVWLCVGCAPRGQQQRPTPQLVKTYTVEDVGSVERDYAGMATADYSTNLAFKVGGQVVSFDVSEGEYVEKGRIVAEINPRDYQLAYDASRSTYAAAKSALERAERLLERQAISQSEYETAQNNYAGALAAYRNAEDVLADTRLRTPISGIVEKKYVDTYQRVSAGEIVVRIVDPVTRTVKFTMPESGIALLDNPLTRFSVTFDNFPERRFAARLKDWVRTSSDGTGVPVSLAVDVSEGYHVSPGMACMVRVDVSSPEGGVVVPLSAVWSEAGNTQPKVWVIRDDRVHAADVTLGPLYGSDMVVVERGLRPGMSVVTAGVYKLSEGRSVTVIND
ncbi:MAG: efflux RND transporter periplasmic adaptor subunit [Rikenellaceae bacterium]|nr:efflux RND transporter periplasmic adaptor subunit [Rikenellaceae bacterium]